MSLRSCSVRCSRGCRRRIRCCCRCRNPCICSRSPSSRSLHHCRSYAACSIFSSITLPLCFLGRSLLVTVASICAEKEKTRAGPVWTSSWCLRLLSFPYWGIRTSFATWHHLIVAIALWSTLLSSSLVVVSIFSPSLFARSGPSRTSAWCRAWPTFWPGPTAPRFQAQFPSASIQSWSNSCVCSTPSPPRIPIDSFWFLLLCTGCSRGKNKLNRRSLSTKITKLLQINQNFWSWRFTSWKFRFLFFPILLLILKRTSQFQWDPLSKYLQLESKKEQ